MPQPTPRRRISVGVTSVRSRRHPRRSRRSRRVGRSGARDTPTACRGRRRVRQVTGAFAARDSQGGISEPSPTPSAGVDDDGRTTAARRAQAFGARQRAWAGLGPGCRRRDRRRRQCGPHGGRRGGRFQKRAAAAVGARAPCRLQDGRAPARTGRPPGRPAPAPREHAVS